MVAIGTTFSAFWILALNSWMHTPTGFEMRDGVAFPVDWWAIIFNPSFPYRLGHMLLASVLTASFFIAGISAYRLLKGDVKRAPRVALKAGLMTAALVILLQIFVGDLHGLNTLEHQPQKVAAMEGLWETKKGVPLVLFGIPNEETRSNDYEIAIPKVTSLILTHELDGEVKGLNDFEGNHPPVKPVFFSFRIMLGTGVLMLLVSWVGAYTLRKKKQLPNWMLKVVVTMTFSGWVATLAGWYVTETGRQPWLVTGVLKTVDAVTPIGASNVGFTLALYGVVYVGLMWAYIHTLKSMAQRAVEVKEYAANESPRWSQLLNKEQETDKQQGATS
jgi:cytochrome d ubiquinol oxidase subunit I